jgi:ABC-type uncharacterized transport system auxiliary subunit
VNRVYVICVVAGLCASACALTSRSEPMQVRYFSADPPSAGGVAATAGAAGLELRLSPVRSSAHLGQDIAFRTATHELAYYDDMRWTERPSAYLERELERKLFEQQGVTRVVSGPSETLTVELVAFEEVRGATPVGRVVVRVILHDERRSQLERTIAVEHPVSAQGGDPATRAVSALSAALDQAVDQIAGAVTLQLRTIAAREAVGQEGHEAAAAR